MQGRVINIKYFRNHPLSFPVLFYTAVSCLVASRYFFADGVIGNYYDWFVPQLNRQLILSLESFYLQWLGQGGGAFSLIGPGNLFNILLFLGGIFNLGGVVLTKGLPAVYIFLSGFGMYLLSRDFSKHFSQKTGMVLPLFIGLLYALSPIHYQQLTTGAVLFAFSYSIAPYTVLAYLHTGTNNKINWKYILITSFLYVLVTFQLQFLVMAWLILLTICLIENHRALYFKNLLLISLFTFLLLQFWFIPTFATYFGNFTGVSSSRYQNSVIEKSLDRNSLSISSIFSLKGWFDPIYQNTMSPAILSIWYISAFAVFSLIIVTAIKVGRNDRNITLTLLCLILLFVFVLKGSRPPVTSVLPFLYQKIFLLQLFRSLHHFMFVLTFAVCLIFSYTGYRRFTKSSALLTLVLWGSIFFYPSLIKRFGPNVQSYTVPDEISNFIEQLFNQDLKYKTVFLPASGSTIRGRGGGGDPTVYYNNKYPLFSDSYQTNWTSYIVGLAERLLYEGDTASLNLLSILNVKYIIVRPGVVSPHMPWGRKYSFDGVNTLLGRSDSVFPKEKYGSYNVFELIDFVPYIYKSTPTSKYCNRNINRTLEDDVLIQNMMACVDVEYGSDPNSSQNPIIEYRSVNPSKSYVNIKNASGLVPVILQESYNTGWKAYIKDADKTLSKNDVTGSSLTSDYKILAGNGGSQATKDDIVNFVNNGWLSTLGNMKPASKKHYVTVNGVSHVGSAETYSIGFVSKLIKGTIQNDNLPIGTPWETWFPYSMQQIPDESHYLDGIYANGWLIDVEQLCKQPHLCNKNNDGTYNISVIFEFWPQRLFYIGLCISSITAVAMLILLTISFKKCGTRRQVL